MRLLLVRVYYSPTLSSFLDHSNGILFLGIYFRTFLQLFYQLNSRIYLVITNIKLKKPKKVKYLLFLGFRIKIVKNDYELLQLSILFK
jgi:hypothetical protein